MDDDVLDDHLETDANSFGEWIEQVADSRGVSEDELLHQLMSSYWMMDELATVIDDLEIDAGRGDTTTETGSDDRSKTAASDHERARSTGNRETSSVQEPSNRSGVSVPGENDEGVIELIETLKGWKSARDQPESSTVDENLIDLIQVIQEGHQAALGSRTDGEVQSPGAGAAEANETVQLIRALKEFSEPSGGDLGKQLEAERQYQELEKQIEELEGAVETATQDVQRVDQNSQQRTQELAQTLQRVNERLDSIEESLAEKPDAATVDKLEGAINDVTDQVTVVQSRVDSRYDEIESEFDNVEQILEHLFDRVDENAAENAALADRLGNMQSRMEVLDDLEAVGSLKRKANRAGISTADCGSCGESVDVGQLTEPACPFCNTEYDGLATDKKWGIFSHHTLTEANSTDATPDH